MTRSFKVTAVVILILVIGIASWVFVENRGTQDTSTALPSTTQTQPATPPEDDQYRDDLGGFTVKCEVTSEKSPNKTLGYMVGHSYDSLEDAIDSAQLFKSFFMEDSVFQECEPQEEYIPFGAYDANMESI